MQTGHHQAPCCEPKAECRLQLLCVTLACAPYYIKVQRCCVFRRLSELSQGYLVVCGGAMSACVITRVIMIAAFADVKLT